MNDKIISVIIPNFKHRQYLMRAIQSILSQTFEFFEILILNDDEETLREYELIDSRIKVFDRINGKRKTSEERLNLIADKLCQYWCYQDADGISYPHRLANSLSWLRATNSDIITTDGIYRFRKFAMETPKYTRIDTEYGVGAMSSVFAKKEVLQKIPFKKFGYGSDGIWWWQIQHETGFKYHHLKLPTYEHLDYVSNFRKFKNIPVLRKLYRLIFLKPELRQALRAVQFQSGLKIDADNGEL